MCTEAIRRERSEKCPSQVVASGNDVDLSGQVPQPEAHLAALPGLQCLLGARALRRRKGESGLELGTYRWSKERIGVAGSRERIIETKPPPDRPVQASGELRRPCDDHCQVATESC